MPQFGPWEKYLLTSTLKSVILGIGATTTWNLRNNITCTKKSMCEISSYLLRLAAESGTVNDAQKLTEDECRAAAGANFSPVHVNGKVIPRVP